MVSHVWNGLPLMTESFALNTFSRYHIKLNITLYYTYCFLYCTSAHLYLLSKNVIRLSFRL